MIWESNEFLDLALNAQSIKGKINQLHLIKIKTYDIWKAINLYLTKFFVGGGHLQQQSPAFLDIFFIIEFWVPPGTSFMEDILFMDRGEE